MAVLGSSSLIVFMVCGRKATFELDINSEHRRWCVEVEVAVPGSPSLIVRTISAEVKQH